VLDHIHWFRLSGWRWLLILEGIPAIASGFLTYFLLPNRPNEARFLTTAKRWLNAELAREEQQKTEQRQFSRLQALASARVWHLAAIYFDMLIGLHSVTFWAPQVVKSLLIKDGRSRYPSQHKKMLALMCRLFGAVDQIRPN
jgi:MFS transporter, ACS family, tartrate transporter